MSSHPATSKTNRQVEAVRIPQGESLMLPAGTDVIITQALGGCYTVLIPSQAGLFRIEGKDADALGLKNETAQALEHLKNKPLEEQIWEQLKTCYDPEIPVNIVDLGLVYSMNVAQDNGVTRVDVKITLTAPGCGMGPTLAADAQSKILQLSGVTEAKVELVWDPPWSPDRVSPEGKKKLGMA